MDDRSAARAGQVRVVIRGSDAAKRLVRSLGGAPRRDLELIGGFAADVPAAAIAALRSAPQVRAVWLDAAIAMSDLDDDGGGGGDDGDDEPDDDEGGLAAYDRLPPNGVWRDAIRLPSSSGDDDDDEVSPVTVAVIDTGVVRTVDLERRVAARVDFTPERDGVDRYGHGTHMAGVIAGEGRSGRAATGAAPDARLISLKVAGWNGATDISTVIAAMQWVVANRDRYAIRVLSLSFGTDSRQSALVDPLDYAVERVWDAGVLVVVSAGNRGPGPDTISKPGDDARALTVGAADVRGTAAPGDDAVAEFSSHGPTQDGFAKPDVLAPGISILSARAPGSTIDSLRPLARVGTAHFKGTGTSQAAAIVAGVAALLFRTRPSLTPDEAKAALVRTANPALAGVDGAGAGLVDARAAIAAVARRTFAATPANHGAPRSSGLGSLDASRGSYRVAADLDGDGVPEPIAGEVDVLGGAWSPASWGWAASPWALLTAILRTWSTAPAAGPTWSGAGWDAKTWSAKTWSELAWDAKTWSAKTWSADLWE